MSQPSHRVRVRVGGVDYTLRGTESEERMRDVAKTVDDMLVSVQQAQPNLDLRRAALLTALNLADELHRLREQYDSLIDLLEESSRPRL